MRRRMCPRWVVAVRVLSTPIVLLGYVAWWPCAAFSFGWSLAESESRKLDRRWDKRYGAKEPQP